MSGPSRVELEAARGRLLPDVLGPTAQVLFVGINPSLYSAALGFHYARPGNRFWPALHRCGLTPREFAPREQAELLPLGVGLTNIVPRTTAAASELSQDELRAGAARLVEKVERLSLEVVAIVGIGAYRSGFVRPKAKLGQQQGVLGGARLWVLPNPSGLNAHYQIGELARLYGEALADGGVVAS